MDPTKEAIEITSDTAPFQELEPLKDTPIAPAHGIAAIALNMAMKYHDMCIVKDGVLHQQYKLEGVNIRTIALADVFETAIKIEMHLLGSSDRIAKLIIDALEVKVEGEEEAAASESEEASTEADPLGAQR